jgi:hypothetical protein
MRGGALAFREPAKEINGTIRPSECPRLTVTNIRTWKPRIVGEGEYTYRTSVSLTGRSFLPKAALRQREARSLI